MSDIRRSVSVPHRIGIGIRIYGIRIGIGIFLELELELEFFWNIFGIGIGTNIEFIEPHGYIPRLEAMPKILFDAYAWIVAIVAAEHVTCIYS